MEDKEKMGEAQKPERISYEQLKQYYSELQAQYTKAMDVIRGLRQELDNREMTSFILSTLFKVMDHPHSYDAKFVAWAKLNIQNSVTALVESMVGEAEAEEKAEKDEKA